MEYSHTVTFCRVKIFSHTLKERKAVTVCSHSPSYFFFDSHPIFFMISEKIGTAPIEIGKKIGIGIEAV